MQLLAAWLIGLLRRAGFAFATALPASAPANSRGAAERYSQEKQVLKIVLWIVAIIFIIGLLVVTGILSAIF